jgi:copper transport protein
MTRRGRGVLIALISVVALAAPAAASAHAYLTKTFPSPSTVLDTPPPIVALTFDEAVEPRFAIISVTDKDANQVATDSPQPSPTNPDTLVVHLKPHLPEGWYLVYWRAISVDGHPVQGAFTFAVGPNPGPAPQFVIPHIAKSATTTALVVAKWAMFLTVMASIGLLAMRLAIARPLTRRVEGTSLRAVTIAFAIVSTAALVLVPVFLGSRLRSTPPASSTSRAPAPRRTTAYGRAFVVSSSSSRSRRLAWIAIWVDRPDRDKRSIAEILAGIGVVAAAAAVVLIPGTAGHAAQTSPRGLAVALDWLHVASGSLWVGGLAGLVLLWATLPHAAVSPGSRSSCRGSRAAPSSVAVLLGSGVWASVLKLPILSALWTTSYGQTILVKASLLAVAMGFGAVNFAVNRPRLVAARARPEVGPPAVSLLGVITSGEVLVLIGAIAAAAVLTSLAPPSKYLGQESGALAKVGPGPVAAVVQKDGYTLKVIVDPNKAAAPNRFALEITKNGRPVTGANVTTTFAMLDMEMGSQEYQLTETSPGVYSKLTPALVMVGHWGLSFNVTPKGGQPFTAVVVDRASG